MKIEKVNDNQIRCTITKEDLANRQLRLSELAYGTEKAKILFRDMIQQANYEFGFEANDIPLMVEAIPLSTDSIILVITKVEYPEELDTRFSRFSDSDEESYFEDGEMSPELMPLQGADDVLGLFRKMKQEAKETEGVSDTENTGASETKVEPVPADMVKMFEFGGLEQLEGLARVLEGYYTGQNDLYKDDAVNCFYLMLHKSHHTPEVFNKVCNMASEYAQQKNYTRAVGAYFEEHGRLLISNKALHVLAGI